MGILDNSTERLFWSLDHIVEGYENKERDECSYDIHIRGNGKHLGLIHLDLRGIMYWNLKTQVRFVHKILEYLGIDFYADIVQSNEYKSDIYIIFTENNKED